jgi:hypothetical protein
LADPARREVFRTAGLGLNFSGSKLVGTAGLRLHLPWRRARSKDANGLACGGRHHDLVHADIPK